MQLQLGTGEDKRESSLAEAPLKSAFCTHSNTLGPEGTASNFCLRRSTMIDLHGLNQTLQTTI